MVSATAIRPFEAGVETAGIVGSGHEPALLINPQASNEVMLVAIHRRAEELEWSLNHWACADVSSIEMTGPDLAAHLQPAAQELLMLIEALKEREEEARRAE